MAITFTPSSGIKRSTGNTHYFDENRENETVLGTFSGLNLSAGSYTIASASPFAAFYKLVVNNAVLELRVANKAGLDYEAAAGAVQAITIEAGTGAGRDAISLSLNVENVNEIPTGILLRLPSTTTDVTTVTIDENMAPGRLGSLRLQDPDDASGDFGRLSARWQIDPSSPYANLFEIEETISGGVSTYHLRVKGTIDYESLSTQGVGQNRWIDLPIIGRDNYGNVNGNSITQNIRIVVRDVAETPTNQAPHTVRLDNATNLVIAENTNFDGALSAQDDGLPTGSVLSYSFDTTQAGGGNANGLFVIVNGRIQLAAGRTLDFEAGATYTIYVRASDGNQTSQTQAITFNLTNVNERPTDVGLSGTSVSSTAGGGTPIGNLTFVDPDAGATGTYTIFSDPNGYFQIGSGTGGVPQLQVRDGATLAVGTYTVTVRVTDQGGLTYDKPLTITVTSGNTAPTNIALSSSTVAEDQTGGAPIGNLSATDAQGGQMTFSVLNDPDNKFEIVVVGGVAQLRVRDGATFNYEGKTTHDVRIQVTDSGGLTYDKLFTINVTNVNERPTDIGLSGTSVSSTAGGGTPIGNLTFADPDAGATGTYTIFSDPNGYFQIGSGTGGVPQLQVRDGATLAVGTYTVTVRVTDQGGLTYDKPLTISVVNGNVKPRIEGADSPIVKTTPDTANVQPFDKVTIIDSGPLTVVVTMDSAGKGTFEGNGTYNPAAGTFTIFGSAQEVTAALQALRFSARDKAAGAGTEATNFTITVIDSEGGPGGTTTNTNISVTAQAPVLPGQNQGPNDIVVLSGGTVQELTGSGILVATFGAQDPDDAGGFVYSIVNPDGRFAISGNQLVVANGVMLDFEQATSHTVKMRVTDKSGTGLSYEENITIGVSDVARELMSPASASPLNDIIKASKTLNSKDVLYGGAGDDKLWGGYGNDTLWGGVGKDVFVFDGKLGTSSTDRKVNFDTIKDYDVKNDSIWLENTLFKSNKALYASTKKGVETKPAKLASKFFTVGDKAKDSDDYFVYDAKKRVLYYDADGSGSKAAIELATFTNNKALKNFKATELFFI